jgi:Tat protein translocase TatB subunit
MGIGNIGWTEFLVILAIALIFFGPRRLPSIAQTIGKSLREFQKALNEVKSEIAQAGREADARNAATRIPPRPAETAARQSSDAQSSPSAAERTREAEVVVEEEDEEETEQPETDSEVSVRPKRPKPTAGEEHIEPPPPVAGPNRDAEPEPTTDDTDAPHANTGDSNRS